MIKQQSAFHSVQRLCGAFGLSPNSYYRWLKCPAGKRQQEDQALSKDIKRIFRKRELMEAKVLTFPRRSQVPELPEKS
jgi:hypothetical protein